MLAMDGGKLVRTEPPPIRRLFVEEEKQVVMDLFDEAMEKGHLMHGV